MASKMENWIAYQQGHLSPEAFEAWKASDLKVQSWLRKREGVPAVVQRLEDLQRAILKKVIGPALQKASDELAEMERSGAAADHQTGMLEKSIGSTKVRLYAATFCGYVASGPRRGFARAVQVRTASGKWKKVRKAMGKARSIEVGAAAAMAGGGETYRWKNPVAYAQYLRGGRRAIFRPASSKAFPMVSGGATFFRRRVKEAPAKNFMAAAESAAAPVALRASDEMKIAYQNLLPE